MASHAPYRPLDRSDVLPRTDEPPPRNVAGGVLAALGLAILLLGVPIALVLLVGNPLPTSLPSLGWLSQDVTPGLLLNLVALLVWLVWGHFVVCVLSEWRALRAGRVPSLVPLGGGSQLVARRLIAGVLLLAGAASVNLAFAASQTQGTSVTSTVSGRAPGPSRTDPGDLLAPVTTAMADAVEAGSEALAPSSAATTMYTVPHEGVRRHDSLWDIAERFLGDPRRYREILELNRDRVQPDGRTLADSELVRPGWQLIMPADAAGPGLSIVEHRPPSPPPAAAPLSRTPEVLLDAHAPVIDGADRTHVDSPSATRVAAVDLHGPNAPLLGLGGGLLLAGLVTALRAKRGPYGAPTDDEDGLRLAANAPRADLVDRGLRLLAGGRRDQGLPLPDLTVIYVNDDRIVAHLAGGAVLADAGAPPAPWRVAEEGASWRLDRADLPAGVPASARGEGPAPYPALVNIAHGHGFDVLVDLEYAPGLIAVGGVGEVAREVAVSAAVDLATHAWSDGVAVTMVGFGDDLSVVAPHRISTAASLDEVLAPAEQAVASSRLLLAELGVEGVLSGRLAGDPAALSPHVLVLSGPPSAQEANRLNRLVAAERTGLAVVCVGDAAGARWRFGVAANGTIDLGVLGASGEARRFSVAAKDRFAELIAAAGADAVAQSRAVETASAGAAPALGRLPFGAALGGTALGGTMLGGAAVRTSAVRTPAGGAPAAGKRTRVAAYAASSSSPARVRILGAARVEGPGALTPARRDVLAELITLVALSPGGLHEGVLRVSLWPLGVSDDVVEATLRDAQAWLGRTAAGVPRLSEEGGRWRVLDDVYVDALAFETGIARAGSGSGSPADEGPALLEALDLIGGEVFAQAPPGRYHAMTFHRSARELRTLGTAAARRCATLLLAEGLPDQAERALRQGLALVPASQPIWRDLLRLLGDDPRGPGQVAAELRAAVPAGDLEPETLALLAHLLPSSRHVS